MIKPIIIYTLSLLAAMAIIAMALAPFVDAYEYESKIDPQEFFSWIPVKESSLNPIIKEVIFINPNQEAEIKVANVLLLLLNADTVKIIAYSYEHKGVRFVFNLTKDRYIQTVPPKTDV